MKQPTYDEIIAYGRCIKNSNPATSALDLKNALTAKFINPQGAMSTHANCVAPNPIFEWIRLISIACNSLRKLYTQDKRELLIIQGKIDRAIADLKIVN